MSFSPRSHPAAMPCMASVIKKARAEEKEPCSEPDSRVGIGARSTKKPLSDLKMRGDPCNCQHRSDHDTEEHCRQTCPLDARAIVPAN